MKHTKGPWKIAKNDSCCVMKDSRHIATAWDPDGGRSEVGKCVANARLIAAAPEMFKELEKTVSVIRGAFEADAENDFTYSEAMEILFNIMTKFSVIVAKAEGEDL